MKTLKLCIMILMSSTLSHQSLAVQMTDSNSDQNGRKSQPQLQLLDKAWSLRTADISKKLAFVEQLLSDVETQSYSPQHKSRINLAIALIAVSEKGTELAAADLVTEAAKIAPLKLNKTATQVFWKEFFKRIDANTQLGSMALTDVAYALETAKQGDIDPAHSYYLALSRLQSNESLEAISILTKVAPTSQFYRQAKLQEGLLLASQGKNEPAIAALEMVIALENTDVEKQTGVSEEAIIKIKERALINLARIQFDNKKYKEAVSLYRSIDPQSPLFYESLSEQGWAFFLAGHPNRALGAGYGATSPYFNQQFQPDQYFLKAAVNYWLCDFKAAKAVLESFARHSREDAKLFRGWGASTKEENSIPQGTVAHQSSNQDKAFTVIEGLYLGVNPKNNLLGPKSLQTLGRNRTLMSGLNELNQLRNQRNNIEKKHWPLRSKKLLTAAFVNREEKGKQNFGKIALSIVQKLKNEYEKSLQQMRIIHLEIMTAEKDKLMRSGRTVEGQQFTGTEQDFLDQFQGNSAQLWVDNKMEFWKDELDSFVFNKKSQCEEAQQEEEGKREE